LSPNITSIERKLGVKEGIRKDDESRPIDSIYFTKEQAQSGAAKRNTEIKGFPTQKVDSDESNHSGHVWKNDYRMQDFHHASSSKNLQGQSNPNNSNAQRPEIKFNDMSTYSRGDSYKMNNGVTKNSMAYNSYPNNQELLNIHPAGKQDVKHLSSPIGMQTSHNAWCEKGKKGKKKWLKAQRAQQAQASGVQQSDNDDPFDIEFRAEKKDNLLQKFLPGAYLEKKIALDREHLAYPKRGKVTSSSANFLGKKSLKRLRCFALGDRSDLQSSSAEINPFSHEETSSNSSRNCEYYKPQRKQDKVNDTNRHGLASHENNRIQSDFRMIMWTQSVSSGVRKLARKPFVRKLSRQEKNMLYRGRPDLKPSVGTSCCGIMDTGSSQGQATMGVLFQHLNYFKTIVYKFLEDIIPRDESLVKLTSTSDFSNVEENSDKET